MPLGARPRLPTTREGGGLIHVPAANDPLLFAAPADLSFGRSSRERAPRRSVDLTDAGGGAGTWAVAVAQQGGTTGGDRHRAGLGHRSRPAGRHRTAASTRAGRRHGLRRPHARDDRPPDPVLVPDVATRSSAPSRTATLTAAGSYRGTTAGKPSTRQRAIATRRRRAACRARTGPEQVFRFALTRAGRELRRGRHRRRRTSPRASSYAGNENHLDGLRRPAARDQPVPGLVRDGVARRRGDPPGAGRVRRRLRHAGRASPRAPSRSGSG